MTYDYVWMHLTNKRSRIRKFILAPLHAGLQSYPQDDSINKKCKTGETTLCS